MIQLINLFNNSYFFLWDGRLARPGAGKMPTPQEYLRQKKTAVSLSSRAGECGNRKSDRILTFRNTLVLHCSQYQTSSQLQ
ncbi:MAG: hypothetical protein RM049_22935 [Nostoc sp. DedQUE04]|uniref:hypothetical protein n=1 Tax=Nostoc sp. DedQUE04 TaxID=3075390 RepID=UPI002AD30AB7|nr:hypothetical protein [Nostoc sp. DedQUE04]MDZ8138126.1 hypothetical protein [Nostoc sp. DedQUE04]